MENVKFVPLSIREVMSPHTTLDKRNSAEERYMLNLRRQREKNNRVEAKIIFNPSWPNFEQHSQPKLLRNAFQLIDLLEKNDIQFYGVGVNASMKRADTPELVIYVDRSTRGLVYAIDIPTVFQGLDVVVQVAKKNPF